MNAPRTTTRRPTPTDGGTPPVARAFRVVWQHPETRQFSQIGRLDVGPDGYRFAYCDDAAGVTGFEPFLAFPDLGGVYESSVLFPFFQNRVLSARRPNHPLYLERLGLGEGADPVEVLARSGGGRATDTIHLVPEPALTSAGVIELRFLASGVRHADPDGRHLGRVRAGDVLGVHEDVVNPVNPLAIQLENGRSEPLGWVPDHLLDVVRGLRDAYDVYVLADVVNTPETPAHLRLLCLLEARPPGAS